MEIKKLKIKEVIGDDKVAKRLKDMGFVADEDVEIRFYSNVFNIAILKVKNTMIALRSDELKKIIFYEECDINRTSK